MQEASVTSVFSTYQSEFPANSQGSPKVGYENEDNIKEVRSKVFSEEDVSNSQIKMRKWKRVALIGVAATVVGGGLIGGGVLSGNPWLIVAGAITAIAGIILICVGLKKGKKEAILYNQIKPQEEPMPYPVEEEEARTSLSQKQDLRKDNSFASLHEDDEDQDKPPAASYVSPPGTPRGSTDSI